MTIDQYEQLIDAMIADGRIKREDFNFVADDAEAVRNLWPELRAAWATVEQGN